MTVSYLNQHPCRDETFERILLFGALAPENKFVAIVLPASLACRQGLDGMLGEQDLLTPTDEEQLLILGLKETNADGQIDGHDPELGVAGEIAIQRIDDEHDDQVNMEDEDGSDGHWNLPHANDGVVALPPQDATQDQQD